MNDLIEVPQTNHWRKLKSLVLDCVSYPSLLHGARRPWVSYVAKSL